MCSIAGSFNKKEVKQMLKKMSHRGPDDEGIVEVKLAGNISFYFGMGRLSIIDLESKNLCPYENDQHVLVFNGEVYNYIELKKELKERGYEFETDSDIEVVAKAYKHWGTRCLDKFNGMFAFAIYSKETHELFLARDIAGQKPLYYRDTVGEDFAFASEAKALGGKPTIYDEYFELFQHCQHTTLYDGVLELLPTHFIIRDFTTSGVMEQKQYWKFKPRYINEKTALEELDALLEDAIKLRQRADVPYALYASGGVDSTLIRTFDTNFTPIKYEPGEGDKADFEKNIEDIVYHLDFPVGSFSSYGLFKLAQKAKEKDSKVVLSGEGADEIFAGYMRYLPIALDYQVKKHYPSYTPLFNKAFAKSLKHYAARFALITKRIDETERYYWLMKGFFDDYDPITAMQLFDFIHILPSLLQMGDRMAMMFGIENRCPFLDKRVIEFGLSLPPNLKIKNFQTKYLLRKLLEKRNPMHGKYFEVEKEKTGLLVPYNKWCGIEGYSRDHYFNKLCQIWKKQNSVQS